MSNAAGHWRLSCRCEDNCTWSHDVVVPREADTRAYLLVRLRAHADKALHGRIIEGVAVGVHDDGVQVLVLRHP